MGRVPNKWPWTITLTSQRLILTFSTDTEHPYQISWKSDLYVLIEKSQRTNSLTALRNRRQSVKATTVCPECSCTTNHWYATYGASHQFCSRSIGYRSGNGFRSRWQFWSTSASTGVHHTWLMTAAGSATAGPVLDRHRTWWNWTFHRPERRSATDRLLSVDHASGRVLTGVNSRPIIVTHCFS